MKKERDIQRISATLYSTTAQKAKTSGKIVRLKDNFSRSFQSFDADSISDMLRRTIRHITDATLISASPTVLNMVIVEDIVEDIIDDSMVSLHS